MSEVVTMKEVYELVLRVEEKLDTRLRSLERWRAWTTGIGAVVMFLLIAMVKG